MLEEEWKKQKVVKEPELFLINEIDQSEVEESTAYDGKLNSMTFNLIKNNRAFDTTNVGSFFDMEEEDEYDPLNQNY